MTHWIYPTKGRPIIVEAETNQEAKTLIAKCPDYDGGNIIAIPVDFYAKLCKTGAVEPALHHFEKGAIHGDAERR